MKIRLVLLCLCLHLQAWTQLRPTTTSTATVKVIPAKSLRGKEYQVSVSVKSVSSDTTGAAGMSTLQVEKGDYDFIPNTTRYATAISDSTYWQTYTLNGKIDSGAHKLWIYLQTSGNGDFYFDNILLKVKDETGQWQNVAVPNGDFESSTAKDPMKGLENKPASGKPGIHAELSTNNNPAYKQSLHIHTEGGRPAPRIMYGRNRAAGKYISSNDTRIYYETYGEGEPLLLLHGNGGSINSFARQIPEFARKYKVIAVDTRGQGNSTDTTTRHFSYDLFAADIKNLLDTLQLKQVNIVGWSDGGNTGLILAAQHPGYVKKLVTMGANLNPSDTAVHKKVLTKTRKDIKQLQATPATANKVTVRLLEMLLQEPDILPEDLGKITARTLVMAGSEDLIREDHTRFIADHIPHASLIILKGQTHFVPEEDAPLFNKTVLDFLSE